MTHTPDHHKIAEKAMNARKSDLSFMNPLDVVELTFVNLALGYIKLAERQRAWRDNGHDRTDNILNRGPDLPIGDSLRGDVK